MLAHVRLLGQSRILREVFDNELLSDLTVVHFGLGIFFANTPRNWDSPYTRWPESNLLEPEYMTPPMFGGRWRTWRGSEGKNGRSGPAF